MYISSFKDFSIENRLSQKASLSWIASVHAEAEAEKARFSEKEQEDFLELLTAKLMKSATLSSISFRHFAIDDVLVTKTSKDTLYQQGKVPYLSDKMNFYKSYVSQALPKLFPEYYPLAENMIHVSCTGYIAPSPIQIFASGKKTAVTHCYHMGCYAAMPALRMAQGFEGSSEICHTELCSLHMHPLIHSQEQLVIESLFADGIIAYSCTKTKPIESSLKVIALHEKILLDTAEQMSWIVTDPSFAMTLTKEVPLSLAKGLDLFLKELAYKAGLSSDALFSDALFALHPGGPKIIDHIQSLFSIPSTALRHSRNIFSARGNMSSATIPYIWSSICSDQSVVQGSFIVSLAFGPGLTISGALMIKS
jgi:predicted naringenin-chalcone synthase